MSDNRQYKPKAKVLFGLSMLSLISLSFASAMVKNASHVKALDNGYAEGEYQYYSGNYYSGISDSTITTGGTSLLSSLCSLIQPSSAFGYDNLLSLYHTSDVYPADYNGIDPLTGRAYPTTNNSEKRGKIWDPYSDSAYVAGGSAENHSYNQTGMSYNREHTIPQSWFGEAATPKSDPHHVLPTDGYVNNQRGNFPYGETSSGSKAKGPVTPFGELGSSSFAGYSGTIWEPDDAYKGDLARGILYMAAAYYSYSTSFAQNASAKACFTNSGGKNTLTSYYVNLLTKWSAEDPVSQKEIDRNNAIHNSSQNNRNPFIDHPTWVNKIWGGTPYTWNEESASISSWSSSSSSESSGSSSSSSSSSSSPSGPSVSIGSITYTDVPTSYETSPTPHVSSSGISFTTYQCAHYSGTSIQFKKSAGYLYNNDPIDLDRIVLTAKNDPIKVYGGNAPHPTENVVGDLPSGTYDLSGYKYFTITTGSNAGYCDAIEIFKIAEESSSSSEETSSSEESSSISSSESSSSSSEEISSSEESSSSSEESSSMSSSESSSNSSEVTSSSEETSSISSSEESSSESSSEIISSSEETSEPTDGSEEDEPVDGSDYPFSEESSASSEEGKGDNRENNAKAIFILAMVGVGVVAVGASAIAISVAVKKRRRD